MEGIDRIVRKLRANMTIMGMGFRLSTILTQTAGYANSIEALGKGGEKWFGIGAKTAALDPAGSYKFVIERRSEEHTSELQSLMRISYAVFCLKKKKNSNNQ